jgi:hypothetical protein
MSYAPAKRMDELLSMSIRGMLLRKLRLWIESWEVLPSVWGWQC